MPTPDPSAIDAPLQLPALALPALRAAYAGDPHAGAPQAGAPQAGAPYARSALTPRLLAAQIADALEANGPDPAWITRASRDALLAQAEAVMARGTPATLPLYGVPFAVKDNIDVAGQPTTAACPAFAYLAGATAPAVQRLLDAGAILVGKTNLDQFATGLVGTRSPYGAVPNAFNATYISGGSSSGSAVATARGLVSFALGTDTAGSGRVPAGFNNLVGLKPTRGLLSTRGVVPACRSLDCVSVFALTTEDAAEVLSIAAAFDAADPYSRVAAPSPCARIARVGVPHTPEFYSDAEQQRAYAQALDRARKLGLEIVALDFAPLYAAAELLYGGPWVAERHAAIRAFFDQHAARSPDVLDPSVRAIIGGAAQFSATDAFLAQYRLAELKRVSEQLFARVDALLVPTAPSIYTIAEVQADPIRLNTRLGLYTNFVNLLDAAALAVPAALRADGLPFGVTFIASAFSEPALLELGARWQRDVNLPLGATGRMAPNSAQDLVPTSVPKSALKSVAKSVTPDARTWPGAVGATPPTIRVAVVGAHLTGMPLNRQLTERGAQRVAETTTAPRYRLYALANTTPPKPGLERVEHGGRAIALEVWEMPLTAFGSFVAEVPPPLGIGSVELADGTWVKGFICEPYALAGARDISSYGGWRSYIASAQSPATI